MSNNFDFTESERAYITKAEGMPLFSSWDGPTMPIHGVEDELGTPEPPALPGDVNGDGTVDVADIAAIIDVMAGVSLNPDADPEADDNLKADVNGDGTVDVADIAMVIDIMAGNTQKRDLFKREYPNQTAINS